MHQGRGYAREAVVALSAFALEDLELPKLMAITESCLGLNCSAPPSLTPRVAGTFDRTSIRSGPKKG